jgi:hypothetical protein
MARPAEVSDEFKDISVTESVLDITSVPDNQTNPWHTTYFSATGLPDVSLTLPQDFSMLEITLSGKAT